MGIRYSFIPVENTTDDFILKYEKDGQKNEIKFKRTIDLAKDIEGVTAQARIKMYKELAEQGLTRNDFIIKKENEDGSITYDETNYLELEKKYMELSQVDLVDKIIKKLFKMDILTFINTFELQNSKEQEEFIKDLTRVLGKNTDDTPSDKHEKSNE